METLVLSVPETYIVAGHLKYVECEFLYNVPYLLGEGLYVDLGTFKGKSAALLAGGIKDAGLTGSRVITVDTFDSRGMTSGRGKSTYDYAVNAWTQREIEHLVLPMTMTTSEAFSFMKHSVRFVFIDAEHSYEAVREDFTNWSTLVDLDGIVAFHDSTTEGVAKFLSEIEGWKQVGQAISLTWWKRQ